MASLKHFQRNITPTFRRKKIRSKFVRTQKESNEALPLSIDPEQQRNLAKHIAVANHIAGAFASVVIEFLATEHGCIKIVPTQK